MDYGNCDLIPRPDPEALTGPFPLLDCDVFPISRDNIVKVLCQAPKLYNNGNGVYGVRVSRISENVAVKYGAEVKIHEARNMMFAAQHSSIAVPLVHDFWEEARDLPLSESDSICYIVMQFVHGNPLHKIWSDLDENLRSSVNEQLFAAVSELQSLTAKSPGPVGGGKSEGWFFTIYGAGPFNSTTDIESWFNERLVVCQDFGRVAHTTSFTGQFRNLVMCHMDLHMRNLILDRDGKLWLIDWANAGFYPPYFEVAVIKHFDLEHAFQGFLEKMPMDNWKEKIARLFTIGFALTTGAFCKPRNQSSHPPLEVLQMSRAREIAT